MNGGGEPAQAVQQHATGDGLADVLDEAMNVDRMTPAPPPDVEADVPEERSRKEEKSSHRQQGQS